MRNAVLLLLLSVPAAAVPTLEALRLSGERFHEAPVAAFLPGLPLPGRTRPPILQPRPAPLPLGPNDGARGKSVRLSLAAQLDRHRVLTTRQLGDKPWDLGMATDPGFSQYFLTFSRPGAAPSLAATGSLDRLRGPGVDARVDATTVYNLKVSVNLFNPVKGSKLKLSPTHGTRGPSHELKGGQILDAVRSRAFVFSARGAEYWLLYGTDAAPDGSGFLASRSFLIIRENGLDSQAWPFSEASIPADAPVRLDLGGVPVSFLRTSGGELIVTPL